MAFAEQKAAAVTAASKSAASAQAAQIATQAAEAAEALAVADAKAAAAAVSAIQPDPVTPPVVTPPVVTITPDGYAMPVVDKSGVVWSIVNGQLAVNDKVNPVTNRVTKLYAKAGVCYFENADGLWYQPNPDGVSSSTPVPDPTPPVVVPPIVVPPTGNGFAEALAGPSWYKGKIAAPVLKDDFTGTALDTSTWWGARNPGEAWSGPFNKGEQEIFTPSQVSLDGQSWLWLATAKNDTGNRPDLGYKSGCVIAQKPFWLWGENTFMQARVIFMPGSLNWQSIGGYGALNGYPYELDWFELVGGMLLVNKHTADANGNNTEIGQSGWGPANPADGKPHDIALEWVPGKLSLYFDHVLVASRNVPRDRAIQKYSVTMNNAIRGGGTPTLGRSMGIDYMVLSPLLAAA